MLACAQEIFFKSESNNTTDTDQYKNDCQHQEKRPRQHKHVNTMQQHLLPPQQLQQHDHVSNKEKEEQQVWPPDVEAAFIKALETIPKLGRRKILVNGKPCGRNELISDFIFRKTSKIRTRKQVSSHIQVLKNTRKSDPHFMRLLTDSVEDEGFATTTQQHRKPKQANTVPRRNHNHQKINVMHSSGSIMSSDESSMSSSPSPADYVFDIMYHDQQSNSLPMLDMKDPFYEPFFNYLGGSSTSVDNSNNSNNNSNTNDNAAGMATSFSLQNLTNATTNEMLQQLFPITSATSESNTTVVDLLEQQNSMHDFMIKQPKKQKKTAIAKKYIKKQQRKSMSHQHINHNLIRDFSTNLNLGAPLPGASQTWIDPSIYPLWPNYICLYLEYSLPYDPTVTVPHTLTNLPECNPNCIPTVNASLVAPNKCPLFNELTPHPAVTTLSAKVKLSLNWNMTDFFFNNTSFFETPDRRTIECTTTIYSFGNVVLESKEVQQALWVNEGKYMYSFVYVNQFFDAFMKGIRSLQSWEEVDIAINNLCVVQVFEDVESKFANQQQPHQQPTPVVDDMSLPSSSNTTNTDMVVEGLMLPPASAATTNTISITPDISPLLVMIYEFERGQGTMDISIVDTTSNKEFDFLASNTTTSTTTATSAATANPL